MNMNPMQHTFIDLFAGCGGFSLGFIQGGLKCVGALEYEGNAASTYWRNLCYSGWSHLWIEKENEKAKKELIRNIGAEGKTSNWLFPSPPEDLWLTSKEPKPCLNLFCWDITQLDPEQFMQMCGIKPGEIGIICGGPPCQGFSTSNSKSVKHIDDERNQLFWHYFNYVKAIQPHIFIAENVPGILRFQNKKDEEEGPVPRWIRGMAADAGFSCDYEIHDMADYGVPQHRRRVLFVGFNKNYYNINGQSDLFKYEPFDVVPEKTHGPGRSEPHVTVMEAIGDKPYPESPYSLERMKKEFEYGDAGRTLAKEIFEFGNHRWYIDETSGLFAVNQENYSMMKGKEDKYTVCIHCGVIVQRARTICHRCGNPKSLHSPNTAKIYEEFAY